jgi:hypothetical protein
MPIYRIHSVSHLEDRLKVRFNKLINELSGNRITAQQAKRDHFDVRESEEDSEFYRINQLDLRLAIEDFNAILKELKKFASK